MTLLIDGRRALFEGLVDYAGLFPPASLPMGDAAAEYRRARADPNGWMLGRFLCPASRLDELAGLLTGSMTAGEPAWGIGVVFDGPAAAAALQAASFDRYMTPAATVVVVEARAPAEASDGSPVADAADTIAPILDAAFAVSADVMPFIEITFGASWENGIPNAVAALADLRKRRLHPAGAKMRMGGLVAEAFPSALQVAVFIIACVARDLPFKATAGLHHPVRHEDAEMGVWRHGFLNLLAATALAADEAPTETVTAAVSETDAGAFTVSPAGLAWRERRLPVAILRRVRLEILPAYGSCSFDEPVTDLVNMGILLGSAV